MKTNTTLQGNASAPEMGNRFDIIYCSFLVVIALVIVVGNCIIICAIRLHKASVHQIGKTHTVTFSLVMSLAVTDIIVGLICIPFRVYGFVSTNQLNGEIVCLLVMSTDITACTSSIFHLLMMSVDRYLAICRPLFHRSLPHYVVHIAIAICWVIPTIMVFPVTLTKSHFGNYMDGMDICQPFDNSVIYKIISTLISFVIPSMCICALYSLIYQAVKRNNSKPVGIYSSRSESDVINVKVRNETAAAKTLAIILVCFFACWGPFFTVYVLTSFVENGIPTAVALLVESLGYVNSVINPLLYYRCNKSINVSIKTLFNML